jgi:hypothetical protein
MKKYKITESQYNQILKELEQDMETPSVPVSSPILRDEPIDDVTLDSVENIDPDDMSTEQRITFLEDFLRDLVDFQEFMVYSTNDALKEMSDGEIGIPRARERFEKLTTRGGRKKFYSAKRGLR